MKRGSGGRTNSGCAREAREEDSPTGEGCCCCLLNNGRRLLRQQNTGKSD